MPSKILAAVVGLVFTACSTSKPAASTGDQIWVQRPDGTMTCQRTSAEDLTNVGRALTEAGVHISAAQKGFDGLEHEETCGKPTGVLNTYRIPVSELATAQSLGFQELSIPKITIQKPVISGAPSK
jgi:hypothetical protein